VLIVHFALADNIEQIDGAFIDAAAREIDPEDVLSD
jgi:hypothetical protein